MKVGIDISQIVYETGVSSYTKNLVKALLTVDKEDEFVLFGSSLRKFSQLSNYHTTPVPGGTGRAVYGNYCMGRFYPFPPTLMDLVWNRLHVLPVELLIGKIDVFHSSDWTQPPSRAYKVTTVHDLAPLRFPSITPKKIVEVHKRRLEWVKKEVDKIIAVSEFTKKEIIELLGVDEDRVVVIPEAADSNLKRAKEEKIEEIKGKYGIEDGYLLVVGADARKNIAAVLQAFSMLDLGFKNKDLRIVIVGRVMGKVSSNARILTLGHVNRFDLASLYSGAEALVYPSLYEGFGLPILEAMQVGCPVVTSNVGAMAETAGNGAVLVNPNNVEDIKGGIEEALGSRNKWVEKGKKRVKEFSWEKTARKTLKVYGELMGEISN